MATPASFLTSTAMPVEWLDSSHFITAIGCNLAIASISEPDKFEFLEGHSQLITAFGIDPARRICVSGQCGKESHTENATPVIAWDLASRTQKLVLRGHKSAISKIAVSEDARICAISDDFTRKIWIWDLEEQDLACRVDVPEPATSLVFGGSSKDTWYLHVTSSTKAIEFTIHFDQRTFEYKTSSRVYENPKNGYRRTYNASNYRFPHFFVGTGAGELGVYNAATATLRAHIQVDKFRTACIAVTEDPGVILLAGRGLALVKGNDVEWKITKTAELDSPVSYVSVQGSKALVRTEDTALHIVDLSTLSRHTISQGTFARPVRVAATDRAVALALEEHGLVIAAIERGKLQVECHNAEIQASAVTVTPINTFVVGCVNGTLCSVDEHGQLLWRTERVHRGKITAICATAEFIATGGEDGMIRVVSHQSRSLLNEIMVHTGYVEHIIPAFGHPERIHSVSKDRTMTTTDISNGKRICQQMTSGRIAFTSLAQFTDGETEILVSMGDGSIRAYDWPRQGIIFESETPQKLQINWIALKPGTRVLACGGLSEYLAIGDFNTGSWKVSDVAHSTPVHCVTWTPNGRYLISVADDGVCLWNV